MLLTEKEAAERLRVSKTTLVMKLMKQPGFPAVRLPGVRRVLIDEAALNDWVLQHRTA